MSRFSPKGDKAQWRLVYDRLVSLNIGEILTYDEICSLLGKDHIDQCRGAVARAHQELLRKKLRAIAPVTNVGYRIVNPTEHEGIARGHHRKSRRSMGRGVELVAFADRSGMTDAERTHFDRVETVLTRQADMIRRIDLRTAEDESVLIGQRRKAPVEKVDRVVEALRRHGIEITPIDDDD